MMSPLRGLGFDKDDALMEEAYDMTFGTCGMVYAPSQPNIPPLDLNVTLRRDDITLLGFTSVKNDFFVV
jgi:hypothetical protein